MATSKIPYQTTNTEITPTVGFQVEEFTKNSINFTVYDMSGQGRYRSLWEHYYTDVEAVIFVLDSTDRLRMCVAKEELTQLLSHEEIKKTRAPVLFFANKVSTRRQKCNASFDFTHKSIYFLTVQMDIPGALTPEECMDEMDLDIIRDKAWHIT